MASSKHLHDNNLVSLSSQIIDCAICLETLKTPKGLPCFHTFCLECLRKYGADKVAGDELSCPLRRQTFCIPKEGFERLPTNFFIQDLLEGKAVKNETKKSQSMCDMRSVEDAGEGNLSRHIKYCTECDQNMCEQCVLPHSKGRFTRSHKVVLAEERQGIDALALSKPHFCESHEDQSVKLYCNDCKKPICLMCKAVNHDVHPCTELKEAAQKFIEKVTQRLPEIVQQINVVQKELTEQNEDENDLMQQINKAEQLISERCKSLIEVIEKQRDELLDKLNTFKEERHKVMETRKDEIQRQLVILSSFKAYVEKLIEHGSAYEISRSAEELLARAKDLVMSQAEFNAGQLTKSHVTFNPASIVDVKSKEFRLVGDVIFNTDKRCATVVQRTTLNFTDLLINTPVAVHVMSRTGRPIYVTGIASLGSQIYVASDSSEHIDSYSASDFAETGHVTVAGMKSAWGMVASQQLNSLFIGDNALNCIHKVNVSDSSTNKWWVNGKPAGVSFTRSQNLLVAIYDNRQVNEFTTSGRLIRTIELDASIDYPWHCLELFTGQFVVSHSGRTQHRVCIVDREGRIVTSYGGRPGSAAGQLHHPRGLAVDSSGHVLVADLSTVSLFSLSLAYLGNVTLPGHQLNDPFCLHPDELDARLYIGEWCGERVLVVASSSSK